MGDKTCPVPCMCLEACLCPGLAASASGMVIRQRYGLGLDEDDVRLIRCSNCLQIFSCLCNIIACITPCEGDDALARIVDCIADVVFCCVAGCMTAQCYVSRPSVLIAFVLIVEYFPEHTSFPSQKNLFLCVCVFTLQHEVGKREAEAPQRQQMQR